MKDVKPNTRWQNIRTILNLKKDAIWQLYKKRLFQVSIQVGLICKLPPNH